MELMKRVLIRTLPVLIFTIMSCNTDNSSMEGYDNSRGNIINIKPNDD